MTDRQEEINCVLNVIQIVCETAKMSLIAKERNGQLLVVIKDDTDGKEYAIARKKS